MEQIVNNAATTTTGSINNSSDPVTFGVTDPSAFPTSGNFRIKIESEILLVTSVSGSNFTAKRAQENTTIASHSSGTPIVHGLTKASLLQIIKERSWQPYELFTPQTYDDEFDDNNFSGWTTINNTGGTVTPNEYGSRVSIAHPGGGSSPSMCAFMKSASISVGDWIEIASRQGGGNENYPIFGLVMADGITNGSGTQAVLGFSPTEHTWRGWTFSGYNSAPAQTVGSTLFPSYPRTHMFLRMTYTSSNSFKGQVSCNGKHWIDVVTFSVTVVPAYIGFFVSLWGGTAKKLWDFEYFRKGP